MGYNNHCPSLHQAEKMIGHHRHQHDGFIQYSDITAKHRQHAITLSPTFTELTNGMAETPQTVAVARASLNKCIMVGAVIFVLGL